MKKYLDRALAFAKSEVVLCAAAVLAVLSMAAVPPDRGYLDYVDWDTLALLFSLMAVSKGLQGQGVFDALGAALLAGVGTGVYSGFEQAVSKTIRIEKEYRPDPEMTKRYTELFGLYLQLYEANKDVMKAHAAVVRAMEDLK